MGQIQTREGAACPFSRRLRTASGVKGPRPVQGGRVELEPTFCSRPRRQMMAPQQVGLTPQPPCSRPRPKEKRMRSPVRPRFLDWSGCRGRDLTTQVRSARRIQSCHVSRCHDPARSSRRRWRAAGHGDRQPIRSTAVTKAKKTGRE